MSAQALRQQLQALLVDANRQLQAIDELAQVSELPPHNLRDVTGNFLRIPILVAKSNILLALSNLEK